MWPGGVGQTKPAAAETIETWAVCRIFQAVPGIPTSKDASPVPLKSASRNAAIEENLEDSSVNPRRNFFRKAIQKGCGPPQSPTRENINRPPVQPAPQVAQSLIRVRRPWDHIARALPETPNLLFLPPRELK